MPKPLHGGFSIGAASRGSGVNIETIRCYERSGPPAPPPRTAGGHRVYDAEGVKRLDFVRRDRELGFTLDRIRHLSALADEAESSRAEVSALANVQLGAVRRRLADLARREAVLAAMIERRARGTVPDCPILEALFDGTG